MNVYHLKPGAMQVKLLQIHCCGYEYKLTSHEQGLITKGHIAMHTNFISWLYTFSKMEYGFVCALCSH